MRRRFDSCRGHQRYTKTLKGLCIAEPLFLYATSLLFLPLLAGFYCSYGRKLADFLAVSSWVVCKDESLGVKNHQTFRMEDIKGISSVFEGGRKQRCHEMAISVNFHEPATRHGQKRREQRLPPGLVIVGTSPIVRLRPCTNTLIGRRLINIIGDTVV